MLGGLKVWIEKWAVVCYLSLPTHPVLLCTHSGMIWYGSVGLSNRILSLSNTNVLSSSQLAPFLVNSVAYSHNHILYYVINLAILTEFLSWQKNRIDREVPQTHELRTTNYELRSLFVLRKWRIFASAKYELRIRWVTLQNKTAALNDEEILLLAELDHEKSDDSTKPKVTLEDFTDAQC